MSRFARQYDRLVLGHPVPWIVVFALVLAFSCYFARGFKLDASADSLLLEDDKDLIQFNETIDRYQTKNFLIVTFNPRDELFTKSTLRIFRNLRDDLESLNGVDSILSILDVPLIMGSGQVISELSVEAFASLRDRDIDVAIARSELLDSPAYKDLLLSTDGQVTAFIIYLKLGTQYWDLYNRRTRLLDKKRQDTLSPAEQVVLKETLDAYQDSYYEYVEERHDFIKALRAIIVPYREHAEIFITGVPMIADDMMTFIRKDLVVFGVGVALFIIATLAFIFRRRRWVFLPLLSCLFAVLLMMGMLGILEWEVTVISSNFISLMLILTLSMNIHLIVRFRQVNRDLPNARQAHVVFTAVHRMVWPCFYTALTTILAFGSLVSSGIKPVIDFGWMMTIGLSITFLTTFLLFPSVLMLLKKAPPLRKKRRRSYITGSLAIAAEKYGNQVIIVSILLAILSAIGIANLRVENSFINYFSEDTEIHKGIKIVDEKMAGTFPLDVLLNFGAPEALDGSRDGIQTVGADEDAFFEEEDDFGWEEDDDPRDYWLTPYKVEVIKKVHDYLESMPEVGRALSLASFVRFAEQLNDGKPFDGLELGILNKRIPDEMRSSWIDPYVSVEHNEARIMLLVRDSLKDLRRKEFIEGMRNGLHKGLGLSEEEATVSGMLVLYNNMLQSLFRSQILTLGLVLVGIAIMLFVLFRSVKLAIIGIVPNLLAVAIVLGLMGFLKIPLDMMTITIAAITMGIAIDNSIHYIYRFREVFRQNNHYARTLKICHQSVGRAVLNTSITVIFGFSILVLSNFIPTIYFGIFTGLAMLVALLAILALLPKLILLWRPF